MNNALESILNKKEYLKDYTVRLCLELGKLSLNNLNSVEIYALLFDREKFSYKLYKSNDLYEIINTYITFDYILKESRNNKPLDKEFIYEVNRLLTDKKIYQVIEKEGMFFKSNLKTVDEQLDEIINSYNGKDISIYHKLGYLYNDITFNRLFEKEIFKTITFIINYELLKNNLFPIVLTKEEQETFKSYMLHKNFEGIAKRIRELSEFEKTKYNNFK